MLCSLEEMGFESSNIPKEFDDGILILDQEYPLGMSILKALKLDETDTDLLNIRDEMLALVNKLKYLLTLS